MTTTAPTTTSPAAVEATETEGASSEPTRADVCLLAIAELFRGDGERLCNPIGYFAKLGGYLARASFEPELMMIERDALFVDAAGNVEGWNPYRRIFDIIWRGDRHVVMGASQIDRFGNQNLAAIGTDLQRPKTQLIGFRGAPGNTVSHTTSYWVNNHNARVFSASVDVVCGVGYDRAAGLSAEIQRDHELRGIVTNLGVFDFRTPDHSMRIASIHPGVTIEQVRAATGFELVVPDDLAETPKPDAETLALIHALDPRGLRFGEVPEPSTSQ